MDEALVKPSRWHRLNRRQICDKLMVQETVGPFMNMVCSRGIVASFFGRDIDLKLAHGCHRLHLLYDAVIFSFSASYHRRLRNATVILKVIYCCQIVF